MSRQQSLPNLIGPSVLHNHSINSWLEQQDFNLSLPSPSEGDAMSISDILGMSSSTIFSDQLAPSSPGVPYSPITPNSLSSSTPPIDSSSSTSRNFESFQFSSTENTPMREFPRNFNPDSFSPLSSSVPTSSLPRSFRAPLQFRDTNSPLAPDNNPFMLGMSSGGMSSGGMSSGSVSPDSDHSVFSNLDNSMVDLMGYLNMNEQQNQVRSVLGQIEMCNLQKSLQTLSALQLFQIQELNRRNQLSQILGLNHLLKNGNAINNFGAMPQQQEQLRKPLPPVVFNEDLNLERLDRLDRMAKNHRTSASASDPPTQYRWRGVLPQKTCHPNAGYSNKVFLGGLPLDATEQMLQEMFNQFGQIIVEWPAKERRGYAYSIFPSENHVKALLSVCSIQDGNGCNTRKYFFRIPGKYQKTHKIEVIPWVTDDSNYMKSSSTKIDTTRTVFVGALHGQLTAKGLALIMDDTFKGVTYAGIDTDKFKYPLGSGRVTFGNDESYYRAVSAAYIEVQTAKFKRKVFQIDPYLEDSLCSKCGVQQGPYFCRQFTCYRYYCRTCWKYYHSKDPVLFDHKPMTRNSKTQYLAGLCPQASTVNQQQFLLM